MYVLRGGGETVTAKRARKVDLHREWGTPDAQSGGGVGTHVLRGLGFQLQVTIPPFLVLIFYKPSAPCKPELDYNPFER